jgi:hypothetical protein
MKRFFAGPRHSCLLLSLLFALVDPTGRCSLENFGSLWYAVDAGFQAFREKEKQMKIVMMQDGW